MTKKKLTKIALALNGMAFLIGGLTIISSGKLFLAIVQIITACFNFMLISEKLKKKTRNFVTGLIFLLNILVAIAVSIDYFNSGAKYIQFAWIAVAVVSVVALIRHIKKKPEQSVV